MPDCLYSTISIFEIFSFFQSIQQRRLQLMKTHQWNMGISEKSKKNKPMKLYHKTFQALKICLGQHNNSRRNRPSDKAWLPLQRSWVSQSIDPKMVLTSAAHIQFNLKCSKWFSNLGRACSPSRCNIHRILINLKITSLQEVQGDSISYCYFERQ